MDELDLTEDQPEEKPRRESRFFKVLRVMAYAAFVCSAIGVIAFYSSYQGMKQSALDIGEELGKLGDVGNKTPIILNGERIHVASSVLEMSVSETLDRAESLCQQGAVLPWSDAATDPNMAPELGLDTPVASLDGEEPRGPDWKIRQERDGRGVVLCFQPPEELAGEDSFSGRMGRFMSFLESGDLSKMGKLRYLYARPTDTGRTQLIGVWTNGPFNLYAMARQGGGDAPGSDPQDAPRPPDSVRLLSATVEVAPYAVRVYETPRTPADVAAAYDRQMPELGWRPVVGDGDARVYQKDDITVFVTPTVHEGQVLVSMLHMGSD